MRILHLVPEFEEGGVERYVLQLVKEQVSHGLQVSLVTAGGKLESLLPPEVKVIHLPVHRKNLITGLYCVFHLAKNIKKWDLLHAHSRVPAWIAWWTSGLTGIPWIMTAHAMYSLNAGITPLKHANGVICISDAVKQHLTKYLPARTVTVPNGVRKPSHLWEGKNNSEQPRFLFVGRLTRLKGLDTALRALGGLKDRDWTLDVIGDGPQRTELENLIAELGLKERIAFHGFRDDVEAWMIHSSCLLFPSNQEGMGLAVLEAVNVGLPVLASDLEPLRPLASGPLIPPGNVDAWRKAIEKVLDGEPASPLLTERLPAFEDTVRGTEEFYKEVLSNTFDTAH